MMPDPTDEIRAIRHKLAAMFDNDVRRIGADIRRQRRESGRTYLTLPKREPFIAHAKLNGAPPLLSVVVSRKETDQHVEHEPKTREMQDRG